MLLEIFCDKFIENDQVRPAVKFHKGLNVVLGNELGANSIGKSTFLLAIDFAFGGSDYVEKATDIEKNIGSHSILFTFEFNNCKYHFSRSNQNYRIVNECDENYIKKREIPIEEFQKWLANQYQITQEDLTFRGLVSRFFRIYQRRNFDEKRPLYGGFDEKSVKAILAIEKIFNKFCILRDAQNAVDDANEKKKKFIDAQKEDYIPTVRTKREYKEYEKQREQVSLELEAFSEVETLQNRTASEIQNIYTLKYRLQNLRCQRTRLGTKIAQINAQLSADTPEFQNDFCELEKFFNNINLRKIEEIEQFHKKLSEILKAELTEELQLAIEEQETVTKAILQAEGELKDFDIPSGISKKLLREYSDKERQINEINTQLANYDKLLQLKEDVEVYRKRHEELSQTVLCEIESQINTQMSKYNDFIYNGTKEAPVLSLTSTNYDFKTINDSGTGTSYKSLVIFDLSVLKRTNLPAIVHDSMIFKNIGDEPIAKLLDLYIGFPEKQIFIAMDKADSYHNLQAQKCLEENTVLRLSSGKSCLFGWSWSETKKTDSLDKSL